MKRFCLIYVFLIFIVFLTACSNNEPSVSATVFLTESAAPSPVSSPSSQPSTTVTEYEPPEEDNPYVWEYLPGSVPEISDDDLDKFNPKKIVDYLAAVGQHNYRIVKSETTDGKLFLTIEDSRYIFIDEVYEYLAIDFSLTDAEILKIPIFSECIIKDGEMYVNKDEYEHLHAGDDLNDDYFCFNIDEITLDPIPVSKDAKITLYDDEKSENYELTMDEFKVVLSQITNHDLTDMYFKYENGEITKIFQGEEEIF